MKQVPYLRLLPKLKDDEGLPTKSRLLRPFIVLALALSPFVCKEVVDTRLGVEALSLGYNVVSVGPKIALDNFNFDRLPAYSSEPENLAGGVLTDGVLPGNDIVIQDDNFYIVTPNISLASAN
jgi:hypothetical protein